MDQKKFEMASHETGHAVMALLCHKRVKKLSLSEMDSPNGTDKYLAYMMLEADDPKTKFTGDKAIHKIMISLGGFASEVLFSGSTILRGDDLAIAVNITEEMLQVEGFKNWVATLPNPINNSLDMIEDPMVKAYINCKMGEAVKALAPHKPIINLISEELYRRGELTGDEVFSLFSSYMHSNMSKK